MNNFAISSDGIASGLQRSASTLVAAGNSLEQSIAMLAAGNKVIQDPETLGNALKVLSMRIRGVKSDLEDAGEETDGMIENTSKLRDKVKALTNVDGNGGVDILTDSGEFRSTYDILLDIAEVWDRINETDPKNQAALLEILAGKTRGSQVAAILQNPKDLKAAYETAMNSAGSAMAENEKYLDSIQGRIDLFTNSLQTMWMNFLNSDVIKFVVDLGSAVVKLVDAIGVLPTLIGAFTAYKAAAKGLKEIFDSTSVSAKELRQQVSAYVQQQTEVANANKETAEAKNVETTASNVQTEASKELQVEKINEATANSVAGASDKKEGADSADNAAKNALQAEKSREVQKEKIKEAAINGAVEGTSNDGTPLASGEGIGIFAKFSGVAAKAGKAIKVLGVALGKAAVVMAAVKLATLALSKAWDYLDKNVIHRAENIKQEVEELQKTFEEAKDTFDDNLNTLTTSSDTSVYATLQDEFNALTNGVDKYGNNISLTSDQYERYKSICEQIVGIQPSIAAGYDSATKAIGRNASVLSELIELQKYAARQNVSELISEENINKIAENAKNNVGQAVLNKSTTSTKNANNLWSIFAKNTKSELPSIYTGGYEKTKDINSNGTLDDEIARYILSQIGISEDKIKEIIANYTHQTYDGSPDVFDSSRFINDYYDEIKENIENFGEGYRSTLEDEFNKIDQAISSANGDLEEAQNGLINTLLQVPNSLEAGQYYDQLNDASKKFLTNWIKNGSQFKIDPNMSTEEIQSQAKDSVDKIIDMVKQLANEDFKFEYEGQQITAQDFLDKFYDLDTTSVNWGDYKAKAQAMLDEFWNQIGGDQNNFGVKYDDLKVAFGIELVNDESENNQKAIEVKNQISKMTGKSIDEIQDWIDTLPYEKVKRFYEIEWNKVDNSNIKSFGDLEDEIDKQIVSSDVLSVKTYSDLSDVIESFNEIQSQTEEIVSNNTEVTQDYKDSLTQLGIAQEDLNDCFDEGNPLLVKNAALLRKLVAQKKAEKQATIQAAKAQAQMQYKNTVNQLKKVISAMQSEYKANGMVSNATLKTVNVLRAQLTALKQTIQQYAILEIKLTEAANAYDEFEAAKNRDAELSYGDSMIEMLQTINEGFKTGKVGSEAFQASVKALVPESVYKDIDDLEARMIAIHDYIDKNPVFADYFTVDDDGNFSIEYDNMKAFIQDGLVDGVGEEFGVFTGSLEDFDLSDNIQSVKDLADAYGITEAAALAMISTFEQYDASWGDILIDLTTKPLDRQINKATDALDEALAAQEAFIRSGGDINSLEYQKICADIDVATAALNTATNAAKTNAQQWTQLETVYAAATGKISLTQEAADSLARSLGIVDENGKPTLAVDDNGTIQLTQEQVDLLNEKVKKLEEPSIMQVQLRYDDIVSQIDELKSYRDKELTEDDRNEIKMKFGLQEGSEAEIDAKIAELTKERDTIKLKYNITQTTSEQEIGTIEKLQDWETNGMTFSVNAQTEEAKEEIDELNTEKDKLSEPETTTYIVDGTGESTVKSIYDYWTRIVGDKSTTYTVYENKIVTESTTDVANAPSSSSVGSGRPRVDGTAHAQGSWGVPKTETALVGELGPEMLVRNGRWTTVGENGAEFAQVKKGDIIFNHKQTEELLKNGYVTGRGKMIGGSYANGTISNSGPAYYGMVGSYVGNDTVFKNGSDAWVEPWTNTSNSLSDAADSLSDSADSLSDSADDFEEIFDWVEIRLQEIDETLDLLSAKLENAVGYSAQNNIIDQMLGVSNTKMSNLQAGLQEYASYAEKLLAEIPAQYQAAAKDGSIAITEFAGEADEAVVEAIKNYREWIDKVADLTQQIEELKTEIADLAKQKFDNVSNEYENILGKMENATDKLDAQISLIEETGNIASAKYYESMAANTKININLLKQERDALQKTLDEQVKLGNIKVGSDEWYEMVSAISEVDTSIIEAKKDLESFQNAINDIYWDNFDELINRLDYLKDETQNLIDLMDTADMVSKPDNENGWGADDVQWTKEGIASLGLYAQQMEIAEYQSKQYTKAIDDLNKDYANGKYSESEYLEKLNELKSAQYDAIESYYDAQDAIKELNQTRIDAIKDGIEKEIDAYSELIDKKKEELDAEKDLYDFQKSTAEQQKNIADIQRKLAALAGDNSASAIAQRKKLEAELAEAKSDLEESYYDRSVSDRQDALDKELEDFQDEKNAEIEKLEEYLENVEQVVADSLTLVQDNALSIYNALNEKAEEYNLTLSDAIMTPWQDGALAISDYQTTFDTAMSSTWDQLEAIKMKWQEIIDKMAEAAGVEIERQRNENASYQAAKYTPPAQTPSKPSSPAPAEKQIAVGQTVKVKSSATHFSTQSGGLKMASFVPGGTYQVMRVGVNGDKSQILIGKNGQYTGWVWKKDLEGYASGTKKLDKSGIVNIDELGEELVIGAHNGRLTYLEKGSGVIPADLTSNLMKWGELDPQDMLDRNRPTITPSKSIVNTEINISVSYGDILHIEEFNGDDPDEIAKIVAKQFEKNNRDLNNALRRYVR